MTVCVFFLFLFQYIDKDDIERVRQRILERRKFQLLNNVRCGEKQTQQETINSSVKCESQKPKPESKPELESEPEIVEDGRISPILLDLKRDEKRTTPEGKKTENENENENCLNRPKRIVRRTNSPHSKNTKIIVKTSMKSIDSNDQMLIRLTSFQQSIDAKLDEVM